MSNETKKIPRDFKKMYSNLISTQLGKNTSSGRSWQIGSKEYDIEEIQTIIQKGNLEAMAALSNHFYRNSSVYKRVIQYMSTLLLYQTVTFPIFSTENYDESLIKRKYDKATKFIENLKVPVNFQRITETILRDGAYYGILRDYGNNGVTIQDLPYKFCRSRYKTQNEIDVLEFDLNYFFENFPTDNMATQALESFPEEIKLAFREYVAGDKLGDSWCEISSDLGIVFYFLNKTPYFISSIPAIMQFEEALDREARRDEELLAKILIQELPISTKTDELIFSTEEALDIHKGISEMLSGNEYIDAITTFGTVKLEDAQSTNAAASENRIEKFVKTIYDEMGIPSAVFNPTGNLSVNLSITKDTALMVGLSNIYSNWLSFQVNRKFALSQLSFNVQILPITAYNKKDFLADSLKMGQYGGSAIIPLVVSGVPQAAISSMATLENEILRLKEILVPFASSHISGNSTGVSSTPTSTTVTDDKEVGRPELSTDEKATKTISNED